MHSPSQSSSTTPTPDRRQFLTTGMITLGSLQTWSSGLNSLAWAADAPQKLNRFPRMVHDWFVERVREVDRKNIDMLSRLQTRADAERYVKSVQSRIMQSFGPFPERTPLNPRVTGVVERTGYRIEKVIFESRPNFPVTANLYIPTTGAGPFPAVVGTCGHSANGKAAEAYQGFAQGLARLGYVCLIYDPIGQGERLQYTKDDLSAKIGPGVAEHLHAGNQQFLVGEFLGSWRAWDGMCALDYLLTRSEVDPKRVGVTGNSGGGTMTTWLCGVEPRWTMAAPACFVTTFRRNMENELPADTEQCPPRALSLGLDHADFLAAQAPKPVIILAKERDYFDVRGSEEAYGRLKRLYELLGAPDNIALFVGPTEHGYSQENREAMYSWFHKATGLPPQAAQYQLDGVLTCTGSVPGVKEPEVVIEKDETLWCTPRGQVAGLENTRTVFSFTTQKSRQFALSRKRLSTESLQQSIRDVLKLSPLPDSPPDYRNWRFLGSRGYPAKSGMCYAIDTEPGIQAIVYRLTDARWQSRPPKVSGPALLYVSDFSSDDELRTEPLIKELISANPETPFFTVDLRGTGESQPDTCGTNSFLSPYGSDYFYAIHSIMLDKPYPGQKTFDLLRVLQWLESIGHRQVQLVARGRGTVPATFAAVLSPLVSRVTLKKPFPSYSLLAETEHYEAPLSTLVPGILEHLDLPDCYDALKGKGLTLIDPA